MKKIYAILLILHVFIYATSVKAQLVVNPSVTPQQLGTTITGNGVQIMNPAVTGNAQSYGTYNGTSTNLGSSQGILLSTGSVLNAIGPNDNEQKTTEFGSAGSSLLNQTFGVTTYDAATFEFDIIAQGDNLNFNFILGSEEYEEWVGSNYHDVFGFFISGPGIVGEQNLALIPGTATPVSINSVNQTSNSQYYKKNNNNSIQYDGFTKNLYATANVSPCQVYHIKMIIADASDKKWDSGVFIEKIESKTVKLSSTTAGGIANLIEGCNNGAVTFTLPQATSQDLVVEYFISGTATNGTDYAQVGNTTTPMVPQYITIPANSTSASININTVADGVSDNNEYIIFYLSNASCPGQIMDSLYFYIQDSLQVTATASEDSLCKGQNTQLNATGGSTFKWSPASGLSNSNIANPIATPNQTTTYTVTSTAGTCTATKALIINVSDISLSFSSTNVSCNGGNTGAVNLSVNNGFSAFSYNWSGPSGYNASTEDISNLVTGTYNVTVTDAKGCTKSGSISLTQPSALALTTTTTSSSNCVSNNGSAKVFVSGGVNPHSYLWSNGSTTSNLGNSGEGTYIVTVTDANGCTKTASAEILSNGNGTKIEGSISFTDVTCYGGNDGTATINATGPPQGSMQYIWSHGATTKTVTGLTAGFYSVKVTTANGCAKSFTVFISQPGEIIITKSQANVNCYGEATGSATVSSTGGTPPYTYSWSTNPVQINDTATGLMAGVYTITVSDSKGCTKTASYTITQPSMPLTMVVSSQTNVNCKGTATGSASVNASGGTSGYTYSWSTNPIQTGATATNLLAGTYVATATDAKGCTVSLNVTITEPASVLSGTIAQTNVACNGGATGSSTVSSVGGTSPYSYAWSTSPSQFSATATGLMAGTYTVTVKDAKNCTITLPVTITQPNSLSVNVTASDAKCKDAASGSATANVTGGVSSYSYSWSTSPVQTTATAAGLAAGVYCVTVSDANGCTALSNVTINEPATALTAIISSQTNVLCKGGNTGSASVSASGGTGAFTYSWNTAPVQTAATANNLTAGTYVVTVSDANNCTATASVTITEPALALAGSITSQSDVACFGDSTGSATVAGSGGSGSYSYSWNTSPVQTTATATNLAAGTYQASVYDNNGCTAPYVISVTITQPAAALGATYTSSLYGLYNISCNGFNDGSINLTTSGGTLPYTFSWTGPNGFTAVSEDISALYAGTYNVTIKDANGCTSVNSTILTQPSPISFTGTATNASCTFNDGRIDISIGAVGQYNFSWTGPNGFTASTKDISNLATGVYTIAVSNSTTCSVRSFEITRPGNITVSASVTNINCFGENAGKVNITVGGGTAPYTYSWTGPNGYTSASKNIMNLYAGTYTLLVTDNAGCGITESVVINQPTEITSSLTLSSFTGGYNVSCFNSNNGSISTTVTGGITPYTYSWAGPNSFSSTSKDISALRAGTYLLTITDDNNCSESFSATLTQPQQLLVSASSPTVTGGYHISCNGASTASINTSATGGTTTYSYSWTGPSGFSASTANLTNLRAGTYNLTVTDANNCNVSTSITLTEPAILTSALSSPTFSGGYNISCYGTTTGSINAIISGGATAYSYKWTGPNGFTSTNEDINNLYAGTYNLTVTDANGCTSASSITLTQPGTFTADVASSIVNGGYNVGCNGGATGNINTTITGGQSSFSYSWTGPNGYTSSLKDLANVTAGKYKVIVTDANSCTSTDSITLTEPEELSIALSSTLKNGSNISCKGFNDGTVYLTIEDGTPGYTINWTGPNGFTSSSQELTNLFAGTYNVTVTDANGCSKPGSITLTEPVILSDTYTASVFNGYNVSCNGSVNGAIDLTVSGGTSPYAYFWNNNATTQDISGVGAGLYNVIIKDANGCSKTTAITLTEPGVIAATNIISSYTGGNNVSCLGAKDGSVNLSVLGGVTTYSYVWSGLNGFSATTQDIAGIGAGSYTVNVTDANGCTYSGTIILKEPSAVTVSLTGTGYMGGYNISCNGEKDGAIEALINGGISAYTYSWTGPNGFTSSEKDIDSLFAGSYSLTVTDTNGCTAATSITLTEPVPISLTASNANPTCFNGSNGSIDLAVTGGATPYTYFWMGPDAYIDSIQNISNLKAGEYFVFVSDANSCVNSLTTILSEPAELTNSLTASTFAGGHNISCNGFNDGTIGIATTGGTGTYSYSWTGPAGFSSSTANISGLVAGTYSVVTTDANNCTRMDSITLTQPEVLNLSLTSIDKNGFNISCYGDSTGEISSVITGGISAYTYSWSGPNGFASTAATLSGLPIGTYTLTITDTNGCAATSSITLIQPSSPVSDSITNSVVAGGGSISCNGSNDGWLSLTAFGGVPSYIINWRGPDGFTSDSANISNLGGGMYNVTITDANGCVAKDSVTLFVPDSLLASHATSSYNGGFNVACKDATNGSIDLSVTGGTSPYTYLWSNTSTTQDQAGLGSGTYTVTITDANNCVTYDTITLNEPDSLLAAATSPMVNGVHNISCNGGADGNIDLTVSGGTASYNYLWSGPNGFTETIKDISGLAAGAYSVVVTDVNGCTFNTSITLNEPAALGLSFIITEVSCNEGSDGSVKTSVNGGYPAYGYSWTGPSGFTSTMNELDNLEAGTYNLTVTDANGCSATQSVIVTQPDKLIATSVTSDFNGYQVSCNDLNTGTITLNITGGTSGYMVSWTGPSGFNSFNANLDSLSAGTYNTSITDAKGCKFDTSITLNSPVSLSSSLIADNYNGYNISCKNGADGRIDLSVAGGVPPYTYLWSNYETTEDITNLPVETYSVRVTDANNCTTSAYVELIEPDAIVLSSDITEASCLGVNNGSILLDNSGGVAPYNYTWSNGNTTQNISGLPAGSYNVNVTDANNCPVQLAAEVTASYAINLEYTAEDVKCFGERTGSIQVQSSLGTAPYQYNWSDGSNLDIRTGLAAGTYQVNVTDVNGCKSIQTIVINQNNPLVANLQSSLYTGNFNLSGYDTQDGSIDLTVMGGAAPYNYSWSNGQSEEDITDLPAGQYLVVVTDANGCTTNNGTVLTEPLPLEMPSGVSPNGDGSNDVFVVHGLEVFPNNNIVIVNRWGNEVYSQNGYANNWNGTNLKGEQLPEGTYFVILTINTGDKDKVMKGYIDLRR